MRRHSPAPVLILCALIGLTVGAAVLGFLQAPSSADLAVHNAVGETLAASGFTAVSTSTQTTSRTTIVYTAPSKVFLSASAPGSATRSVVLSGPAAVRVLNPISSIANVNGFTKTNGVYHAPLNNPTFAREGAFENIVVTIANGHLHTVVEAITINSAQGRGTLSGTLRFLQVGGSTLPRS